MQAPDGSSLGARSVLLAIAADLNLHHLVVVRALEYAFDNLSSFPSASEAVYFGIIRQGYCVDMQIFGDAVLRLRRNFGGMFDTSIAWMHNADCKLVAGYAHGQAPGASYGHPFSLQSSQRHQHLSYNATAPQIYQPSHSFGSMVPSHTMRSNDGATRPSPFVVSTLHPARTLAMPHSSRLRHSAPTSSLPSAPHIFDNLNRDER